MKCKQLLKNSQYCAKENLEEENENGDDWIVPDSDMDIVASQDTKLVKRRAKNLQASRRT